MTKVWLLFPGSARHKYCERLKSQYEASPEEMQRREAEHEREAGQDALAHACDLETALVRLRNAGGDDLLEDVFGGRGYKMTLRAILKIIIESLDKEYGG